MYDEYYRVKILIILKNMCQSAVLKKESIHKMDYKYEDDDDKIKASIFIIHKHTCKVHRT